MKIEDISKEIEEMAKAWDKIQEDFISAQKKLQAHLDDRGFDPVTKEYDWVKNIWKMTKKEMVVFKSLRNSTTHIKSLKRCSEPPRSGHERERMDFRGCYKIYQ